MKSFNLLLLLLCVAYCFAQPNTDVFLFDLNTQNGTFELSNMKNISKNEGYDNQPSFMDNSTIFYVGTRNSQTDIVRYNVNYGSKIFINHTEGGEYSPLKIPEQNAVSAIRLDPDGKQFLYRYNLSNGESEILIDDVIIGYHVWYTDNIIVSSVLEDGGLSLYTNDIIQKKSFLQQKNIGRSLHRIPNTNLVSYISKEDENDWKIKSLNPNSGQTKMITSTVTKGAEDMCWLPDGTILMGYENKLYTFKPNKDSDWKEASSLEQFKINNITRVSVSPDGTKLAIVGEGGTSTSQESENTNDTSTNNDTNSGNTTDVNYDAGAVVQKHIEPYNQQNLDSFANAFSEEVVVYYFPKKEMYKGRQTLRANYKRSFENNKNLSVLVDKRMVLKNMVIDEEIATVNKQTIRQATIYSTSPDGIETMTFVQNTDVTSNPEIVVNKQLEAYNSEDLEAFTATFTNDVKLYEYPDKETSSGINALKESYKNWFDRVENLNAKVTSRIVIGNKVIDKEEVSANGQVFHAIAIYEVQNGKIKKVTFIQ